MGSPARAVCSADKRGKVVSQLSEPLTRGGLRRAVDQSPPWRERVDGPIVLLASIPAFVVGALGAETPVNLACPSHTNHLEGAAMPDESIVRAKAREVVRQGKLPTRRPDGWRCTPAAASSSSRRPPRPSASRGCPRRRPRNRLISATGDTCEASCSEIGTLGSSGRSWSIEDPPVSTPTRWWPATPPNGRVGGREASNRTAAPNGHLNLTCLRSRRVSVASTLDATRSSVALKEAARSLDHLAWSASAAAYLWTPFFANA